MTERPFSSTSLKRAGDSLKLTQVNQRGNQSIPPGSGRISERTLRLIGGSTTLLDECWWLCREYCVWLPHTFMCQSPGHVIREAHHSVSKRGFQTGAFGRDAQKAAHRR